MRGRVFLGRRELEDRHGLEEDLSREISEIRSKAEVSRDSPGFLRILTASPEIP